MIHLAKDYALSDNGLRKICKKLGIPLPKAGYWAKIKYGKKVVKERLLIGDYPDTYQTFKTNPVIKEQTKIQVTPELQRIIDSEGLDENRIHVPNTVNRFHPLVQEAKEFLKGKKPDLSGMITTDQNYLNITVSPKTLNRALRIFHTLISSLEKRGIEISLENKNREKSTHVLIWKEQISFRLVEKISQKTLTPKEIQELKKENEYLYARREYKPSGNLAIKIHTGSYNEKEFVDGKKGLLEEKLNDIIVYLHSVSLKLKKERIEREEQHRKWELERQQEEAKQRKLKFENLKMKVLIELVDSWNTAKRLREFIAQVSKTSTSGSELKAWIDWAHSKADDMDVVTGDFLASWKWNVDREKNKHWDLRNYESD